MGSQMGSQEGFWNGIPRGIPCGIGRIPGGILILQTFSIYVWLTAGSQVGSQVGSRVESQMGSQVGFCNGIPSGIPGGIRRIPGGLFYSPNIFYICLVHRGIPSGIRIPAGIPSGIPKTSSCQNLQGGIPG